MVSGCCAREMLQTLRHEGDRGAHFPMDLSRVGNPFVNAMRLEGLVRVNGEQSHITGAGRAKLTPETPNAQ